MTPKLQEAIAEIVAEVAGEIGQSVASRIASLIADQPLSELTGLGGEAAVSRAPRQARKAAAGGRMAKRSTEDIEAVIELVVGALKGEKEGLSSEKLQNKLSLSKKEIQRPIILALEQKRISKVGEKRATTYFMPGVGGSSTKSAKPAKKASRKPKKAAGATKVKIKAATKSKSKKKASAKPKTASAKWHKTNSAPAATDATLATEAAAD